MRRFLVVIAVSCLVLGSRKELAAQDANPPSVDSIAVQGNQRLTPAQIIGSSGIIVHQPINYGTSSAPSPRSSAPVSSTMCWWSSEMPARS